MDDLETGLTHSVQMPTVLIRVPFPESPSWVISLWSHLEYASSEIISPLPTELILSCQAAFYIGHFWVKPLVFCCSRVDMEWTLCNLIITIETCYTQCTAHLTISTCSTKMGGFLHTFKKEEMESERGRVTAQVHILRQWQNQDKICLLTPSFEWKSL